MSISRYTSFGHPARFQDEIQQFFDKVLSQLPETDQSNVVTSQWTPRVDIREDADRFVILADIPGVDPSAIEVHMDKGILTIKGERTTETRDEQERYSRIERSHGVFYRRFALPDSADAEGIRASGKHGVLEVVIPKKAQATPRRISVNAD